MVARGLDRREFLARLALVGGASFLPLPACRPGCARTPSPPRAKTFDTRAWAVVEAATARLIPTDDVPGAREANVVGFIDAQLAEPHFAVFRREFVAGVAALDLVAAARFGDRFLKIAPDRQDAVLAAVQDGEGGAAAFSAAHFFQVLYTLTLEGFLSDPVYGGNRGRVGWSVIGYAPGAPRPGKSGRGC